MEMEQVLPEAMQPDESAVPQGVSAPRESQETESSASGEAAPPADAATEGGEAEVTEPREEAEAEEEARELLFPLSYPVPLAEVRETIPFLIEHGLIDHPEIRVRGRGLLEFFVLQIIVYGHLNSGS